MKQFLIGFTLLLLIACGNSQTKSASADGTSEATQTTEETSTSTKIPETSSERLARQRNQQTKGAGTDDGSSRQTEVVSGMSEEKGGHEENSTPSGASNELTNGGGSKVPGVQTAGFNASGEGPEGIVFVGTFAQWKQPAGGEFDGSYDAKHGLFVVCKTEKSHPVPSKEIVYPEFGTCDEPLANRIILFPMKKSGEILPDGHRIQVVGNKGVVEFNGKRQAIILDLPTMKRIDKEEKATLIRTKPPIIKTEKQVMIPPANGEATPQVKKMATYVKPDDKPDPLQQIRINRPEQRVETERELVLPPKTTPTQNEGMRVPPPPPAREPSQMKTTPAVIQPAMAPKKVAADTPKIIQKQKVLLPAKQEMRRSRVQ